MTPQHHPIPADAAAEWARVEAALDALLDLPEAARPSALQRILEQDQALGRELAALLALTGGDGTPLDRPAVEVLAEDTSPAPGLAPGRRVGAYRVIQLIGRGGMGEVYRAERADGQFEQVVALKRIRREAIDHLERFQAERRILARLNHPGITRIYDGGVLEDGQLYMVMELVDGQEIVAWCRDRRSGLEERLRLFLAICDAVAYAHRNFIVHRDLKPGNVLVTADGQVKLLDFGIAKLIAEPAGIETRLAPLTPAYAAPEQLTGGAVSTATDSYALGMLLFELLTDARPWRLEAMPIAAAVDTVLREVPPLPSAVAGRDAAPPVGPKRLRGDLDAIVAKALRKEPSRRYETVDGLRLDVARFLGGAPVAAREGSRAYVLGRLLRRHRLPAASAALIALALVAGFSGVTWQYLRAEREAERSTAIKNFLVSLFRASDPRIASDKPRGEITAKELLDLGAGRIDTEFARDPDLEIELLGITGDIYGYLLDTDRYDALQKRRVELARARYGEQHPIVIDALLTDAWGAIYNQDWATADRMLEHIDRLLGDSGQDATPLRAEWWLAKGESLKARPGAEAARALALDRAVALFARYDPHNASYVAALGNAASVRLAASDFAAAETLDQRALAAVAGLDDRSDMDIAVIHMNLGLAQQALGEIAAAEASFEAAAALARRTTGERAGTYWLAVSRHARLLHLRGERAEALAMFDSVLAEIPADWTATTDDATVRVQYAASLAAEGRAAEAIPLLEASLAIHVARPLHEYDVRRLRAVLGDAYDRAGRAEEAQAALEAAYDEYLAREPDGPDSLAIRERWGRFLLEQAPAGSPVPAEVVATFEDVAAGQARWGAFSAAPALAKADLARLALARGDTAAALDASVAALAAFDQVRGLHDVRGRAYLEGVRSAVLLARQDRAGAAAAAALALADCERYDAPASPTIAAARAAEEAAGGSE